MRNVEQIKRNSAKQPYRSIMQVFLVSFEILVLIIRYYAPPEKKRFTVQSRIPFLQAYANTVIRNFIKAQAPGKVTGCEDDIARLV